MVMTIARWNPSRQLAAMEVSQLHRMFDDLWGGRPFDATQWVPPVDIFEKSDRGVVIRIDLPGMTRDDVQLTVERNVLTVSGERLNEPSLRREQFHRMERFAGAFSRSFSLPSTLDTDKISAAYENGVLTITLPAREEARPRQIAVDIK